MTDIMMVGHFAKGLLAVDGRAETSSGGGIALDHLGVSVAVLTCLRAAYFRQSGGTPGRPIPGPDGIITIVREILCIPNFFSDH